MGSTNLPPDLPVEDTSASNILRSGVVRSHIKDLLSVPPETSDFSSAAKELATSDGVIWTSVDPETVGKNGKLNVLLRGDNGVFVLTVCKPGVWQVISVRVLTPDLAAVKEFLSKNTIEWTEQKEGLWVKDHSASESSTPGATYEFTRHAQISPSLKLVWEGKHTNPENEGGAFTVNDSLSIRDTRRVYPIPGTCKGEAQDEV